VARSGEITCGIRGEERKHLGGRLVKRRETGGKVVNPAEKQKVANGGQVGGQIVVSEIRRVGGGPLDFLDEMD
jgi:hypothetical protein